MTKPQTTNVQQLPGIVLDGRPPLDLGALGGDPARLWDLGKRTVAAFSSLLAREKPFEVIRGASGCTDCRTFVMFNPEDPEGYLVMEHELSHAVFESDPAMAGIYAAKRAQRLMDRAGMPFRTPEGAETLAKLERVVFFIINILDDWRCCWLWTELYPGGGKLLRKRWEAIAEHALGKLAEEKLLVYVARKVAGIDTPGAPAVFQECDEDILWAAESVAGVDFMACMGVAGMLVDKLGSRLIEEERARQKAKQQQGQGQPQGQQPQQGGPGGGAPQKRPIPKARDNTRDKAAEDARRRSELISQMDLGAVDVPGIGQNDRVVPNGAMNRLGAPDASMMARVRQIETAAKFGEGDEFEGLLARGAEAMQKRLADARVAMGKEIKSESAVRAEKFLAAFQVAGIKTIPVKPAGKLPPPSATAVQIRRRLERIRAQRRLRMADDGIEVDFDELLEATLAGELQNDPAVFRDMKSDPGLDLLLLADVSGSMLGLHLTLLDHAVADILAASGPTTTLQLWAYDYNVYIFERAGSLQGVQGIRHGGTFSVQALDAAFEWAKNDRSRRAILFATDGFPTSVRARNSTGNPIKDMNDVIEEIRAAGIPLSVLALGGEALRPQFDAAFGKNSYGLLQTIASLNQALLRSAEVLVEQHMKKRIR